MTQIEKMKHAERIGRLMFNYIRNKLTPKQEIELTAWRNLSPRNEQCFQEAVDPENIRRDLTMLYETKISARKKFQERFPYLQGSSAGTHKQS
jgi:hypothetical protein